MEIYILRHGIAVPRGTAGYPNDDRPLTEEGIQKMKSVAKGIAQVVKRIDLILTSPMLRALETAKITAKSIEGKAKAEVCKELLPGNPVNGIIEHLQKQKDKNRILLVGHEPDLGLIASSLLGSGKSLVELKKGSLCRIDVSSLPPPEPGKLVWLLTPRQLRALG